MSGHDACKAARGVATRWPAQRRHPARRAPVWPWRWLLAALPVLVLGACGDAPIAPDAPANVAQQRIAPWESHEACIDAEVGDRIDFRFEATRAVDFGLFYRQGEAMVIPLSRRNVRVDSGVYEVVIAARYCLAWQAGVEGALLDYNVRVRRLP